MRRYGYSLMGIKVENLVKHFHVKLGAFVVVSPGAVVKRDCDERSVVQPPESTARVIPRDVI